MTYHAENDARVNPRIAFLGGAMLTVVINMRLLEEAIGNVEGLSLLDLLHFAVLVLILAATVESILCGRLIERGVDVAKVRRLDSRSFWICGSLYVTANVAIIAEAIIAG